MRKTSQAVNLRFGCHPHHSKTVSPRADDSGHMGSVTQHVPITVIITGDKLPPSGDAQIGCFTSTPVSIIPTFTPCPKYPFLWNSSVIPIRANP